MQTDSFYIRLHNFHKFMITQILCRLSVKTAISENIAKLLSWSKRSNRGFFFIWYAESKEETDFKHFMVSLPKKNREPALTLFFS